MLTWEAIMMLVHVLLYLVAFSNLNMLGTLV